MWKVIHSNTGLALVGNFTAALVPPQSCRIQSVNEDIQLKVLQQQESLQSV
jgi:hypothetical protein